MATPLLQETSAERGKQQELAERGETFCGLTCAKCVGWRGSGTNRLAWKILCTTLLIAELGYYLWMTLSSPALFFCGFCTLSKFLIEIWGQETPNWAAPGTVFMLCATYVFIFPYMIFTYGYCRHTVDYDGVVYKLAGVILFVAGSSFSLYYEVDRFQWKAKPENKGKLHTVGLAAICIHPNYLGDLATYAGWALVVGTWCALCPPVFMIWSFAFVVIPNSDAYLASRYVDFEEYAAKTPTLFPGLQSKSALKAIGIVALLVSCYLGALCSGPCS